MKKIGGEEIKQIELELLKYAREICVKKNIKYFLGYGTLLGAVRHKGFIPWDDDIDIVLLRQEYEKFIRAVEEDNHAYIKVIHMGNSTSFFGPYAMLVDARTELHHYKLKKEIVKDMGVYIDVFPLDNLKDLEQAKKVLAHSYKLKALNNLTLVETFRYDKGIKSIFKRLVSPIANAVGHRRLCEKIERLSNVCEPKASKYVADVMWDPTLRWCLPTETYESAVMLEFEGELFAAPEHYDFVLKTGYGDYMTFPPEEERVTGHYNEFYWKKI